MTLYSASKIESSPMSRIAVRLSESASTFLPDTPPALPPHTVYRAAADRPQLLAPSQLAAYHSLGSA